VILICTVNNCTYAQDMGTECLLDGHSTTLFYVTRIHLKRRKRSPGFVVKRNRYTTRKQRDEMSQTYGASRPIYRIPCATCNQRCQ